MKKKLFMCALAVVAMFSACSDTPDALSAGRVKGLVEEMLENTAQEVGTIEIPVGYYELNNVYTRYQLARLQAAGLITYQVERYDWWNKILRISSYGGDAFGSVTYNEEKHVMVKVALTAEGKKLVIDKLPEPGVDKDMQQPEIDVKSLPENQITLKNYTEKFENWPEVPCPETTSVYNVIKDDYTLEEVEEEVVETLAEVQNAFEDDNEYLKTIEKLRNDDHYQVLTLDYNTSKRYEDAKKKEAKELVTLKAYKLKVEKARFIQITTTENGIHNATAEVIVKYKDVNPAARAWWGLYDDTRLCADVRLTYYNDKGWVLADNVMAFKTKSEQGSAAYERGGLSGMDKGRGAATKKGEEEVASPAEETEMQDVEEATPATYTQKW